MEGQVVTVKSTGGSANRTTVFKFGDTVETDGPDGNHYKAKTKFEGGDTTLSRLLSLLLLKCG